MINAFTFMRKRLISNRKKKKLSHFGHRPKHIEGGDRGRCGAKNNFFPA